MRIVDVLREPDDGDDGISGDAISSAAGESSLSYRSFLLRLFRCRRKLSQLTSKRGLAIKRLTHLDLSSDSANMPNISLDGKPNEMAFTLGMGIGMAFVLAGNANEMIKMTELRKEIEMLLLELKGEIQRRGYNPSLSCTASDVSDQSAMSTAVSIQQHCSSSNKEQIEHFSGSNINNYDSITNLRGMGRLEEELRVELERMQLNFEEEDSGQHNMKMKVDQSCGSSSSSSSAENNMKEQQGICAYDLERRLHELLQKRQQERIESLESALELAQRKISKSVAGNVPENEDTYFLLNIN